MPCVPPFNNACGHLHGKLHAHYFYIAPHVAILRVLYQQTSCTIILYMRIGSTRTAAPLGFECEDFLRPHWW